MTLPPLHTGHIVLYADPNRDYSCSLTMQISYLYLLLAQTMLPDDKIRCDAVVAVVEVDKPV